MKSILFIGTHCDQPTGYGCVAFHLTNFLAKYYKVYFFAYHNIEHLKMNRDIDKNILFIDVLKEEEKRGYDQQYGDKIIEQTMLQIKPDILFIYNDILVTSRMYNALLEHKKIFNYKSILYIDIVYDYEKMLLVKHIDRNTDHIYTFTKHWRDNLVDMGIPDNKVSVFEHGFDKRPIIEDAKESMKIPEKNFVVLNTNRNTYRKAYDITIRAFLDFYKKYEQNDDINLLINCHMETKSGYNILDLLETECHRFNLDFEKIKNRVVIVPRNNGNVSDDMMNTIYNASDIGINTCIGEGFGLCNLEHASIGKPQIVSNVGGLSDTLPDKYTIKINPVSSLYISNHTDFHGGYGSICDYKEFSSAMEYCYLNRDVIERQRENLIKELEDRFQWDDILQKFHNHFASIL